MYSSRRVRRSKRVRFPFIMAVLALSTAVGAQSNIHERLPHRIFAESRFNIDKTLARPYDGEVPFGASGARVWATSPQGWAFRDGVQLIYITNLDAFDLAVRSGETNYVVQQAQYIPSHVHLVGAPGS